MLLQLIQLLLATIVVLILVQRSPRWYSLAGGGWGKTAASGLPPEAPMTGTPTGVVSPLRTVFGEVWLSSPVISFSCWGVWEREEGPPPADDVGVVGGSVPSRDTRSDPERIKGIA